MVNQGGHSIDETLTQGNCNGDNLWAHFERKVIPSTGGGPHKPRENRTKVTAN